MSLGALIAWLWLGSLAVVLDLLWRTPVADEDGTIIGPSLKAEARSRRRR